LLKYLELEELISENFLCKLCCEESINQKKGFGRTLSEDVMLKATTHNHALACTLIATCASGKHTFKIEPDRGVMETSTANGSGEEQLPRCHGHPKSTMKIQNYCINFYAHLIIQMLGLGQMALDNILGMLGIVAHAGSTTCWATIQNSIGISQQKWADQVQINNLDAEISVLHESRVDLVVYNGKTIRLLTCSFDMRWQKCTASRIYNSPSGHAFLLGTLTGKIICCTIYCKGV